MESVDGFRTAIALHRVRIAQEADQQIAQLLSLGQRLEPSPPCASTAMTTNRRHRKALIPGSESTDPPGTSGLSRRVPTSRREPVVDAAAIRWWDRAAQRCAGDRGAARDRRAASAVTVGHGDAATHRCASPRFVKEPLAGEKALDGRAAALANVLRCRRGLHQLRSHGEARSRATLIAERRLGLLQLRRACAVWRSHGKLAAALHAAAGELRARAQAEHRRLGCRRGLEELLRFCWRARHVAWHVAHTTRLQCALQRRRNDRALGRALRHWWRVASVGARDGLRAERGQRGDTTPLTRPHRPPLAPLASAQHNVPLALKKTVPGPRRPVSKKVVVPGTPYGDGREMLYVEEGLSDLHPPPHRPTVPTQSPLCRPSQIPVFPKSTVRV